mgnify:CR=1 FL=1
MAEQNKLDASLFSSGSMSGSLSAPDTITGNIKHFDKYHTDAYMIAVKHGFEGTEAEWLASLKGSKGDTGEKGEKGEKGDPGTGVEEIQGILDEAVANAEAAKNTADTALENVTDALELAEEAKGTANTALGNANTALINAQSAQDTASNAMDKASNHDHDERYYTQSEVDEIRSALKTLINANPVTLEALGITASATELNYMDGVTSGVQGQLDDKLPLAGGTLTGGVEIKGGGSKYLGFYDSGNVRRLALWADNEGGNIRIDTPDAYTNYWEIDAFDGNLRIRDSSGSNTYSFRSYANGGRSRYLSNILTSQGAKTSGNSWSIAASTLEPYKNLLFAMKDGDGRVSLTRVPIALISTASTKYVLNPLFGNGGDTAKAWGDVTIAKSGTTVTISYTTRVQDSCTISNCTLYLET